MQNWIALIIVAAACAYLAWRGWAFFAARKKAGCASGCGSCPVGARASEEDATQIVTIEPLRQNSLVGGPR